jgi:hypothetical protein
MQRRKLAPSAVLALYKSTRFMLVFTLATYLEDPFDLRAQPACRPQGPVTTLNFIENCTPLSIPLAPFAGELAFWLFAEIAERLYDHSFF